MSLHLDASSVVDDRPLWTIAVNRNQNLLGKVILVAKRPIESALDLGSTEWLSLHVEMRRVCAALDDLFQPDLYNHAFLMNLDAQVHLHVIPRYRGQRQWEGESFFDPHFGGLFGTEQRIFNAEQQAILARLIRGRLRPLDRA